ICRPGDLWRLGRHRILCGNALEPLHFETLMQGQVADAVFTDPPYNVPINGHASGRGQTQHREFAMASSEMNPEQFRNFLRSGLQLMDANSRPGSLLYVFMDWRHIEPLIAIGDEFFELKNVCVWVKTNAGMGSLYRSRHEFVTVFKKRGDAHTNNV